MNQRSAINSAIERGKDDAWSKLYGGFSVFELSNGVIDYFPTQQSPNIGGERDKKARVLARFRWNHERWSRTQ